MFRFSSLQCFRSVSSSKPILGISSRIHIDDLRNKSFLREFSSDSHAPGSIKNITNDRTPFYLYEILPLVLPAVFLFVWVSTGGPSHTGYGVRDKYVLQKYYENHPEEAKTKHKNHAKEPNWTFNEKKIRVEEWAKIE